MEEGWGPQKQKWSWVELSGHGSRSLARQTCLAPTSSPAYTSLLQFPRGQRWGQG